MRQNILIKQPNECKAIPAVERPCYLGGGGEKRGEKLERGKMKRERNVHGKNVCYGIPVNLRQNDT
jgi:hypothetical protein